MEGNSDDLTVTAGIRYNFFNALHAIGNRRCPVRFRYLRPADIVPSSHPFFHPSYNDFDPRLGIAWSHGNTVIRAGGGIYHTDGQEDDQNLPISNTVDRYSFNNVGLYNAFFSFDSVPDYAEAGGLGVVSPRDLDRNRKDDYVAAWTASVQQQLPLNIVATASYLGNKATDVLTTTYTNLVNPATGLGALSCIRSCLVARATWATRPSKLCK